MAVWAIRWRAGPGGGVRGRPIGCDCGWTAFAGPTLASSGGRIVDVISPCDWPTCAWISWPLLEAVDLLGRILKVFRIVWRDLIYSVWVAYIGSLQLEAAPQALEGPLLSHMSAGWERIGATQQRRLVFPPGAGVLACVCPLWPH